VDKRRILIDDIPSDAVPVGSVLFKAIPRNLVVLPVLFEGRIRPSSAWRRCANSSRCTWRSWSS